MTITELLWPPFKPDTQSQAEFAAKSPEIFSHFVGIPGLKDFFCGRVIYDNGEPVDERSGRGALILEWDGLPSIHAFYPHSETFRSFISLVKPYLTGPDTPQFFEAVVSAAGCAETGVTQVLKVAKGEETEAVWRRLQEAIGGSYGPAKTVFSYANGVEKEEGVFLGIVGWPTLEDYQRSRMDKEVVGLIRELGAGEDVFDVVVQLERMAV
ncbi:uncharacterized protein APUU_12259S [Aspergillus puulaauensis]|uniref:ABM domain-containing protein n=1 Tax=Aspergillus puulaauensis TaxID=1220207 RepID=A0A7R7XDZ2_9EURO|nr:uncharacterized protein APUU_12259S [Aspergillus puulaauensis]BCS19431.1 hypothetical protein APUU_12259S [Aspergillus puulaauensis]